MTTVYSGAIAVESYQLVLTSEPAGLDLSTVSAATFHVRDPDGQETTWSAVLSAASPTSLTLTHTFLAGETTRLGDYAVYALLTVPGGVARSIPRTVTVLDEFYTS